MYLYQAIDQRIVDERVAQFRDQTQRYLRGELSEDDFRPLRLRNGLYLQRHAPMLRVAIPYGLLSSTQLRKLADISLRYDHGYAHFSTRQNIQFNWPALAAVPDILAELATVQMHAIQTSGNCIRNTTADQFSGVAADELVNSLVWCEIIRQWSTFHPEFNWLPRKFKIAVNGAQEDRAATLVHDIGLHAQRNLAGEIGFRVIVGGGLGRAPQIGAVIREFLPWPHLLTYLEAILRIYNLHGRRDNPHKARIKFLLKALGAETFARQVEAEWLLLKDGPGTLNQAQVQQLQSRFSVPAWQELPAHDLALEQRLQSDKAFSAWWRRNVHAHRLPGYAIVSLSLKKTGVPPGDVTAAQMQAIADLADRYAFGELRVTHEQNLVLADVPQRDLHRLWQEASALGLATPNIGLLTNIIACPGGDFCSLANAKSIPVAQAVQERFDDLDYLFDIGPLDLNISGCINACAHHHIGHIGVLGVDKQGSEFYQIEIGGSQGSNASLGRVVGPSVSQQEVPDVIECLVRCYLAQRDSEQETFIDVVRRIGHTPFKEAVHARRDSLAA